MWKISIQLKESSLILIKSCQILVTAQKIYWNEQSVREQQQSAKSSIVSSRKTVEKNVSDWADETTIAAKQSTTIQGVDEWSGTIARVSPCKKPR